MQQMVITKKDGSIFSALFENQDLIQINVEEETSASLLGNIYIGKVKNIVKNINAAFVEIADGQMCYLSLEGKMSPVFVNRKNTEKVCIGDEILVQVSRDAVKTKNPSVTTKLQLAGRYLVLTHGDCRVAVSGKIKDRDVRERLQGMLEKQLPQNPSFGVIVRTNAEKVQETVLYRELEGLMSTYQKLCDQGIHKKCFSMLFQALPGYLCDIRDEYDTELEQIVTDDVQVYDRIKEYMEEYQPENLGKLRLYEDSMLSLAKLYGVYTKLEKALQERVWLKSGGYLVIQPTEALTVIDVNTGKAIAGKKAVEKHFLKINMEAAKEIAKQLRLRNLSGIIVIDFIDLSEPQAKKQLIEVLEQEIKKDPVKTVFVDMTKLHLVELTRKKVRRPLHEQVACIRRANKMEMK